MYTGEGYVMHKRLRLFILLLCALCVATGCQAGSVKTRKVLPDWSRGVASGTSALSRPVSLLTDDSGTSLAWVGAGLKYARLDSTGEFQARVSLPFSVAHPVDARLCSAPGGELRLLWIDNPNVPTGLFLAHLAKDGQVIKEPTRLTPAEVRAEGFAVATASDGSLDVFWAAESAAQGGIYHLRLSAQDEVVTDNRLLISGGAQPALQVSQDGLIHLAYVDASRVRQGNAYYATFDPKTQQMGTRTQVAMYPLGTGLISYGPAIGLDDTHVYVFWAVEQRGGGQSPGEAKSSMVSFPLGEPSLKEAVQIDIPGAAKPRYEPTSGGLPFQRLAAIGTGWPTSYLYMPSPLGGQQGALGLFLSGRFSTRSRDTMDVVWVIFDNGALLGYQLLTQADSVLHPVGSLDPAGNAHVAWLQPAGFGAYEIYYASTSAQVRSNLDRVSVQDVTRDVLNALWSLAPAMGFFPPILLLWMILSFVWVVAFYFWKAEGDLERPSARIALVIAVAVYLMSKLFFMPYIVLEYAPFLERLPENLQWISQLGTPIMTLLLGYAAYRLYLRRVQYGSLIAAYFIIVFTDAFLSMIVYIPGLLGS